MKVDVTIATKNNEDTIEQVIKAIQKNIPYNEIILIDDSTDDTVRLARKLGAKVCRFEGLLGLKRVMQAKLSKTEWIASIDSDIVVYSNWWKEMSKFIRDDNVVSIHGYLESDFKDILPEYELYTKFCSEVRYKIVKRSGTIGCVLIKRTALLMCEEKLKGVHAGEDTTIGKVFKKKGFKYVIVKTPVGFHWHKNAVKHHMMAYYRAGESIRTKKGIVIGFSIMIRSIILQLIQLGFFNLINKRFYGKLCFFVCLLSLLYVSGVTNSEYLQNIISRKIERLLNN
jgi:glycosyltransferase involved in cell wall biosynthesis